MSKYCPKCYLSGSQLGTCGNFALGCPDPVDITPDAVVEVRCGPCDRTLAIPLGDIMKDRASGLGRCVSDKCQAKVMLPETFPASGLPDPMPPAPEPWADPAQFPPEKATQKAPKPSPKKA